MMKLENQRDKIFTYEIDPIEELKNLELIDKLCGC